MAIQYGVTDKGFVTKTFNQIRQSIVDRTLSSEFFGSNFPTSPDSIYGNFVAIISAALKESGFDLSQAVYDQFKVMTASGKNLDDIALYTGLIRLTASGSVGSLLLSGVPNATFPAQSGVKDVENRVVLTKDSVTYDRTRCYAIKIDALTVSNITDYVVNVNGQSYTYTSDGTATKQEIVNGIINAIGTQLNYESALVEDKVYIQFSSQNNGLSVTVSENLQVVEVGALVNAEALVDGPEVFLANTLTRFDSQPTGTLSVTNLNTFQLGRFEEDDEAFRRRILEKRSSAGTATKPAIESSVGNLNGVVSVFVKENQNLTTDISDNQEGKSIQVFVEGGDDDLIAKTIWDTKPAAISTFGTTQKIIIDDNGDDQVIFFSRPENLYAYVKVTYTLYTEEEFPLDGETVISDRVVSYGDSLGVGTDIIPKRFEGEIYDAVGGLDDVTVEIAVKTSIAPPLPSDYKTTRISILDTQNVLFSADRISVTLM